MPHLKDSAKEERKKMKLKIKEWMCRWVEELEVTPRGFAPVDRDYARRKVLLVRFPFNFPAIGVLMIRNLYMDLCWKLYHKTDFAGKEWYQNSRSAGFEAGVEHGKTLNQDSTYLKGFEDGAKFEAEITAPLLQCKYMKSWAGRCKNHIEGGFCEEHAKEKYRCLCGKKAIEECGAAGSVVCGRPLCGDEKCKEEHEKQGHYFL